MTGTFFCPGSPGLTAGALGVLRLLPDDHALPPAGEKPGGAVLGGLRLILNPYVRWFSRSPQLR
jgi:hypothetical protein